MPVLTRFPGGGGATGYKYHSRDVIGITYTTDADGDIFLSWGDPEDLLLDGRTLSQWKGTLIVRKEGSAPRSADDGIIICDSTVKDQYKETGLPLGGDGTGYYYGVFPYTKDYVVNVDEDNIVYVMDGPRDSALGDTSWADIAYIASKGGVGNLWNVGDEINVVLSGDYNGTITMQIAGFGHDDLVAGERASMTFLSKQLVVAAERMNLTSTNSGGWGTSYMRNTIMPRIKASLPPKLQNVLKKVKKISTPTGGAQTTVTVEDDLFIPSAVEVGAFDGTFCSSNTISSYHLLNSEGTKYPIFKERSDVIKDPIYGTAAGWWLRSTTYYGANASKTFAAVRPDGTGVMNCEANGGSSGINMRGVCFGFCI